MSRYQENKSRVREIYGIDPKDRSVNVHHIVFRSDDVDIDKNEKSNLIPLKIEDHDELHRRIQQLEEGIHHEISRNNKTSKRKQKRGKRKRR